MLKKSLLKLSFFVIGTIFLLLTCVNSHSDAAEIQYKVNWGDSLGKIALRFGTSVASIQTINQLPTTTIYAGQVISVSTAGEILVQDKAIVYHARAGDTLYKLSKRHGVSVAELKKFNAFDDERLIAGQEVNIPVKSKPVQQTPKRISTPNGVWHLVGPKETLYSIAAKYKVPLAVIRKANNLTGNTLLANQQLFIPAYKTVSRGNYERDTVSINGKLYLKQDVILLARVIYGEARGEPFEGQVAVGAVVLNRIRFAKYQRTIRDVIFQRNAFTAVSDGQFYLTPNQTAVNAALEALAGNDPTGGAIYYYNPEKATSKWIFTRPVIAKIGNHLFAK